MIKDNSDDVELPSLPSRLFAYRKSFQMGYSYILAPVRLSFVVGLSVVCLSVVCNVRAPYSAS